MRARGKNYPWQQWFKRRRFVLRRGEDYFCPQGSMAQQIRNAASRLDLLITLIEEDESFTVFVKNGDTDAVAGAGQRSA